MPIDSKQIEKKDTGTKRGRGRPKGSVKKPAESKIMEEKIESLYNRVKPYLSQDQKDYTESVIEGEADVDPLQEMKILVRQMSILFSEASVYHLNQGKVSQDLGVFGNTLRMAIKDLNDMIEARNKEQKEIQESDDMVSVTDGGKEMERLNAFLREHPA